MRKIKKSILVIFLFFKERRWDLPLPPKKLSRLISPNFWITFLYLYQRRKLETITFNSNIKEFWIKNNHTQPDTYSDWLKTAFTKQYQVFISEKIFNLVIDTNPQNILEAGSGSGHTAACFLSYCDNKLSNEINYTGVDLSNARVDCSKKFVAKFIKGLNFKCKASFNVGDLTKLNYDDLYFDFTLIPSVLERIDNNEINKAISDICRVTKNYIFISDFFDQYPHGYPRTAKQLEKIFSKHGFKLIIEDYVFTKIPRNYCEIHLLFKRFN